MESADVTAFNRTSELMRRFNDAFRFYDPAALVELVAADCTIENTQFELEEVFVAGERALIRWRYRFGPGASDSIRGVNIMRVRDGLIVEALGYVKGV